MLFNDLMEAYRTLEGERKAGKKAERREIRHRVC